MAKMARHYWRLRGECPLYYPKGQTRNARSPRFNVLCYFGKMTSKLAGAKGRLCHYVGSNVLGIRVGHAPWVSAEYMIKRGLLKFRGHFRLRF